MQNRENQRERLEKRRLINNYWNGSPLVTIAAIYTDFRSQK